MESLLNWGIEVVLWFQQFSPALDLPFKILTSLGDKEFFLLLMPLVYWCINRQAGARLFMLLLFSAYLNEVIKLLAAQPPNRQMLAMLPPNAVPLLLMLGANGASIVSVRSSKLTNDRCIALSKGMSCWHSASKRFRSIMLFPISARSN